MNLILAAVPVLLLAADPAAAPAAPADQGEVVDRVAAVVNGDVVMLSELTDIAGSEWVRVQAMPDGPEKQKDRADMLKKVFAQVLEQKLLAQSAAKDGIEITDKQVDASIEDVKTRNRLDQAQLEAALAAQGLDLATYRANTKRDLEALYALQEKVRNRVKIGDTDLQNYYQTHEGDFRGEPEVKLRHIFLPLPENAPAAEEKKVRAEADRIKARLLAGADFVAEAKKSSKGPSAGDGGDLGWVRKGTIEKVDELVVAMKPGEMTDWVRVGPGIHLFKVDEKRLAGAKTFEEAKEEIRQKLYEGQMQGLRQQVVGELKRDAVIETKLPELADEASGTKFSSKLK